MSNHPTFSIIMTSFNYAHYIGAALESVLAQTFSDWELLIVDDCSIDDSWKIIEGFKDPRIRTHRHGVNQGACAAYNQALSMAKGKYIACLDSDDLYMPRKLERQAFFLKQYPEVEICGTFVTAIDDNGEVSSEISPVADWFNISIDLNEPSTWLWQNRICHSGAVVRRETHDRLGKVDKGLVYTPDWQFWLRALVAGARFALIPEPLVAYRSHGRNITHKNRVATLFEHAETCSNILFPWLEQLGRQDLVEAGIQGFVNHPDVRSSNDLVQQLSTKFFCSVASSQIGTAVMQLLVNREAQLSELANARDWHVLELHKTRAAIEEIDEKARAAIQESDEKARAAIRESDEKARASIQESDEKARAAIRESDEKARAAIRESDEKARAANSERDAMMQELYLVYHSWSWRVFHPLRVLTSSVRQFCQRILRQYSVVKAAISWSNFLKGFKLLFIGDVSGLVSSIKYIQKKNTKSNNRIIITEKLESIPLGSGMPLVSVIIPCYNYGKFVTGAVDSVLSQTLKNIEVIVVDGGSTDRSTVETIKNLVRPRTTTLFREGRHLVGDNRNFGISKAQGRYICCLDADDTLDPTYLEKAVFYLETYGFDVVSTSINFVGFKQGHVNTLEYPTLSDMTHGNHVLTCAAFRKSLWDVAGGYFDVGIGPNHVAEDWDFWLRLAAMGARIRNISREYLFNYQVHSTGSLSSAADVKSLSQQREAILRRNRSVLTPEAINRSDAERWRSLRCEPSKSALATSYTHERVSESNPLLFIAMPYSAVGGAERLLSGLASYLVSRGWRILVLTTLEQSDNLGSSIDWFRVITPEVYELRKFLNHEEAQDFVRYLIASRNPDCVLNAGSRLIYEMLPEIKATNRNTAVVDLLFNTVGHTRSHVEFSRYISATFAENNEVVEWLQTEANKPLNLIKKMSSGVNLTGFAPTKRSQINEAPLNIPEAYLVVGFSGRLSYEKGPDIFLQVARLCVGFENVQFVMTGTGPMQEELINEIGLFPDNIKFKFAGLVKEVQPYLAFYDVLILPSRVDGRPLVVMEALASGVPVIASKIGAMPEMIQEGNNGYLTAIGDAQAIADRIKKLASDPSLLSQLKHGARAYAEKYLDENLAYSEYELALRSVIEMNRSANLTLI